MTDNVVIALSCGTNDTNRATRAIHLATIAHKEGKNTSLFLLDEGVYLAKEGIIRTKDLIISEYDLMHLLYCLSSYAKKQHFKFLECLKNIQIVVV
ncbi:MAG: hypothetical protein PHG14_06200, partial [Desulfobacter postgatei]|nr:hypothetical protein [Desulfobacter postgatei]